jgi:hypothetical protein
MAIYKMLPSSNMLSSLFILTKILISNDFVNIFANLLSMSNSLMLYSVITTPDGLDGIEKNSRDFNLLCI